MQRIFLVPARVGSWLLGIAVTCTGSGLVLAAGNDPGPGDLATANRASADRPPVSTKLSDLAVNAIDDVQLATGVLAKARYGPDVHTLRNRDGSGDSIQPGDGPVDQDEAADPRGEEVAEQVGSNQRQIGSICCSAEKDSAMARWSAIRKSFP